MTFDHGPTTDPTNEPLTFPTLKILVQTHQHV